MRGNFDATQSAYPITGEYAGTGKWYVQDIRDGKRLYSQKFSVENTFYLAGHINAMLGDHTLEIAVETFRAQAEEAAI